MTASPPSVRETGGQGRLLSEVAGKAKQFESRLTIAHLEKGRERLVAAAVVDAHDLPWLAQGFEHRHDPRKERIDVGQLVVHRHDERERGAHARMIVHPAGAA